MTQVNPMNWTQVVYFDGFALPIEGVTDPRVLASMARGAEEGEDSKGDGYIFK